MKDGIMNCLNDDTDGKNVFWAPKKGTIEHHTNCLWNEHQKKREMST
jgi:hypothetical protein